MPSPFNSEHVKIKAKLFRSVPNLCIISFKLNRYPTGQCCPAYLCSHFLSSEHSLTHSKIRTRQTTYQGQEIECNDKSCYPTGLTWLGRSGDHARRVIAMRGTEYSGSAGLFSAPDHARRGLDFEIGFQLVFGQKILSDQKT